MLTAKVAASVQTLVAVGGGAGTPRILTSMDGGTWTERASTFGTSIPKAVCWSPSLGIYVASGDSGKLATSPDGINWTARTAIAGVTAINDIAWSPTLGLFVAVGTAGFVASSPDGITWTGGVTGLFGSGAVKSVIWASYLSKFVAVGVSGKIAMSAVGSSAWTIATQPFGSVNINDVAANGSTLLAVGNTENVATSPDGTTWTARGVFLLGTPAIVQACWSPALGLFVVQSDDGGFTTSPTGATWTIQPSPASSPTYGSVWSPLLNMFVFVMDSMSAVTSSNGTSWTIRTLLPSTFYPLYSVAAAA